MTRIYEALERAGRDIGEAATRSVSSSRERDSSTVIDETMVGLYQSINTLLGDKKGKVVQFLGSRAGEGTSTLARKFAKTVAFNLEKRVLLLDADRKKPTHAYAFDLKSKGGWDEAIQMDKPVKEAIEQVGWSFLFVSQPSFRNGSALHVFDTAKLIAFFHALKEEFDLILIDSPPATISADAVAFSGVVDGVVLVVEAEATRYEVAEKVIDWVNQHGAKVLGIVLNKRRFPIPRYIYRWL